MEIYLVGDTMLEAMKQKKMKFISAGANTTSELGAPLKKR